MIRLVSIKWYYLRKCLIEKPRRNDGKKSRTKNKNNKPKEKEIIDAIPNAINIPQAPNEIKISGRINLDMLNTVLLRKTYMLMRLAMNTLSKIKFSEANTVNNTKSIE